MSAPLSIYEPLESRRLLAVGPISDFSAPDSGMGGAAFAVGDVKFYSFNDGIHGYELWRADSSHPKGVLVRDINPTPLDSSGRTSSSNPDSFFRVNNTLLFVANDGTGGRELWRTDGTGAGTYRLFETKAGIEGISSDLAFVPFHRGLAVLTSPDIIYTDGSSAGTRVLSRSPGAIFHANRKLYWIEGSTSRSVLAFDGTTLGTAGMTVPGEASNASLTLDHLGRLIFTARYGTASGQTTDYLTLSQVIVSENVTRVSLQTVKITPIASAAPIARNLGSFNGLGFYAIDGRGMWVTDGTNAGLRQILPDTVPQSEIVTIGARGYFLLESSIGHRRELWSTDGTLAGTQRVRMLDVQPRTSFSPNSPLRALNNRLIFVVRANNRWEMRSFDPLAQRLEFLAALPSDRPDITISDDRMFFSDYDDASASGSFYRTDGTATETRLVYRRTGSHATPQSSMHVLGNRLILFSQQGYTDEIFDSASVYSPPKPAGSNPRLRGTFGGADQMFMTWDVDPETVNGDRFEVWRTDGTDAGTIKLAGFTRQKDHSAAAFKNMFLFAIEGTENLGGWHTRELWRSDGTPDGTFLILSIGPRPEFNAGAVTNIDLIASTPTSQFLVADDGLNGRALWKTDGTAMGTVLLKSFGATVVNPIESPAVFGNIVYFFTDDGVHGRQLWRSDGTAAGTFMIRPSGVTGSQLTDVPQLAESLLVAPGFTRGDGPELFVLNTPATPHRPTRAAHMVKGVLNIFGTSGNDMMTVQQTKDEPSLLQVTLNGTARDFHFSDVTLIRALLDAGHDRYDGIVPIRTSVNGGAGNDTVKTGDAADTLYGGDGDDALYGAGGNDYLWGQAGNDRLAGGGGTDVLWGGEGWDTFVASALRERRDHFLEDFLA